MHAPANCLRSGRPLNDALIPTWQAPNFDTLKLFLKPVTPPLAQKEAGAIATATVESKTHSPTPVERNEPPRKQTDETSPLLVPQHHGSASPDKSPHALSAEPTTPPPRLASSVIPQGLPQATSDSTPAQRNGLTTSQTKNPRPTLFVGPELIQGGRAALPQHLPVSDHYSDLAAAQDADKHMDLREDIAVVHNKQLPSDLSRAPDIPSSPDSTAQTATTPAVHEVSTNTSPENEADSYADKEEQAAHEHGADKAQPSQTSISTNDTHDDTVEAQLLHESAAADETPDAQKVHVDEAVSPSGVTAAQESPVPGKSHGAEAVAPADEAPETASSTIQQRVTGDKTLSSSMDVDGTEQSQPGCDSTNDDSATVHEPMAVSLTTISVAVDDAAKPPPSSLLLRTSEQDTALLTIADSTAAATGLPTPKPSADGNDDQHISDLVVADKNGKRRAPTVLFGSQKKARTTERVAASNLAKADNLLAEDYFTPLFIQTFAQQSKWLKNLDQLVHHARKTISTADLQASIFDSQSCKILKRVYHLQQQDKWSLRQPKRCPEPIRTKSHWDVLLQEMKWMRTDFREERKWKRSTARNLAVACAMWVSSSPELRKALQVNAFIPLRRDAEVDDIAMIDNAMIDAAVGNEEDDTATGDLEPVSLDESDLSMDFVETISPSAIFAMQEDAVVFGLNPSAASNTLLAELPMYGLPLEVPQPDLIRPDHDPDASWRRPVVPVSKYIESPIVISSRGRPRKRGRYDVLGEESDSDDEFVYSTATGPLSTRATTNMTADCDVGLFDPSLKPVRERLHAGHQFRPPSEYPLPLQCFYEYRAPSQWTVADDDQLKKLVRELSYNWSLIASILSTRSLFASGAERRTPWECFERWVYLEGYPSDASRSPYFKIYQSRIDSAQRAIREAHDKAMAAAAAPVAAQPKGANVPPHTPVQRRRPTLAVRVERHRNQKYLAMIEAMRKLAKKREVTLHKQQQQAHAAASRKANEPVQQQKPPTKTPKEYSRLRWEREQKLAERMAELAQRQNEATRRVRFVPT